MKNYTAHTIKLQDGTLINLRKRFKRNFTSLFTAFSAVYDQRNKSGKRHSLAVILFILFSGITSGQTTISGCYLWAVNNYSYLKKFVYLAHGLPVPTTISRAIQQVDIENLIEVVGKWKTIIYGSDASDNVASYDGKTIKGAHGEEIVRHLISLFSHKSHQILFQEGVTQKENEIPAFRRLLTHTSVAGLLLIGDALHTQQETINRILSNQADYLLTVKGNQPELFNDLAFFFDNLPFGAKTDIYCHEESGRGRERKITVSVSQDLDLISYLAGKKWAGIKTVGKITREGKREVNGKITSFKETVYCLTSKVLSGKEIALHTRNHWCIENNLHWQKDYTFLEDRQTLRKGNAPAVMSFFRSMCISLFSLLNLVSVSQTITALQTNSSLHHQFLQMAGIL